MENKITRNDARYTTSDDANAKFRAYVNAMDMGGWISDNVEGFAEAVLDELRHGGGDDTLEADGGIHIEEIN